MADKQTIADLLQQLAEAKKTAEDLAEAKKNAAEELAEAKKNAAEELAEAKKNAAEAKKKEAELRRELAESEAKRMKMESVLHVISFLSNLKASSHTKIYDNFHATSKVDMTMGLGECSSDAAVKLAWNACTRLKNRPKIHDNEHKVHAFTKKVLETTFTKLSLRLAADDKPSLHGRLIPDFVVHSDDHSKASWANALVIVEVEACETNKNKEGFGQAIGYLCQAHEDYYSTRRTLNPECWCLYTNGSEIEIGRFSVDANTNEPFGVRTGPLVFLPPGLRPENDISPGFKLLCSLLKFANDKLPSRLDISIDGKKFNIVSQIASYPGWDVFHVRAGNEDWIVKECAQYAKNVEMSFARQHQYHEFLKGFCVGGLNVLESYCTRTMLAVRPVGVTMETVFEDLSYADKRAAFVTKAITQLNILHTKAGVLHCDIRPSNIVLVGNDVYLIDWETATRPGGLCFRWESQDGYSPDVSLQKKVFLFEPQFDYEMLAYALVLTVKPDAWKGLTNPDNFVNHRTGIMQSFANISDHFLRFAYRIWLVSHQTPFEEHSVLALQM
jgi:hypothetical protein